MINSSYNGYDIIDDPYKLLSIGSQGVDAQICVAALSACATGACWQHALEVGVLRQTWEFTV